jgi:hypothetical protein
MSSYSFRGLELEIWTMTTKLNASERYLVAYYLSESHSKANWVAWTVARMMLVIVFGFGFFTNNRPLIFTAFVTLAILDFYGLARSRGSTRALRSAFEKFEARIEELERLHEMGAHTGVVPYASVAGNAAKTAALEG